MDCWAPGISHYFHGMTHHAPGIPQLTPGTSYYPWNDPLPLNSYYPLNNPLPLNSPLERPTIDLECLPNPCVCLWDVPGTTVSCSTVTVWKCQAALRTLVVFSWFSPTCLCREARLAPQCNAFRDLLFDHPCLSLTTRGQSTPM
ncbi:hypothetical protein Pcinc_035944 [Petrolisthes cinctipes]|uniref:Uncharacterized protein n=1 Tax=Petrolisthes cinctipes TaxID=88211 RepID=A0AAE1BVI0_PETCI|nr:hypothetical protein Pcinc_035944 [Petrolisthes cinctipes]